MGSRRGESQALQGGKLSPLVQGSQFSVDPFLILSEGTPVQYGGGMGLGTLPSIARSAVGNHVWTASFCWMGGGWKMSCAVPLFRGPKPTCLFLFRVVHWFFRAISRMYNWAGKKWLYANLSRLEVCVCTLCLLMSSFKMLGWDVEKKNCLMQQGYIS